MYAIVGAYRDHEEEEIDSFDTYKEAKAMLSEYCLAYGTDWSLRIEKLFDEDVTMSDYRRGAYE